MDVLDQDIMNELKSVINGYLKNTQAEMKGILQAHQKGGSRIINKINLEVVQTKNTLTIRNKNTFPDYTIFVDKGRSPGKQPPLLAIQQWCTRKSIDTRFAFPIARKIGREGLPATNFLDPLRKFCSKIIPSLGGKYRKYIKDNIMKGFKENVEKEMIYLDP